MAAGHGRTTWSPAIARGTTQRAPSPIRWGQYQRDRLALTQLQYQDSFAGDSLQVSGRLFADSSRYTALNRFGTWFKGFGSSDSRGGEVRLLSTALAGHKLMLGIELQDNFRYDQSFRDLQAQVNRVFIPRSGYRAGIYAQDEWRLSGTVAATAGLRLDRNNVAGDKTSPRAAVIWQATSDTTLKALYGRAHRAPNAFERDYDDGLSQVANPALRGERVDTLELEADHRVRRDLSLRAAAYQWTMRDLIVLRRDDLSGLPQYQSGGQVRANGLEMSADKTWTSGMRLRASLSARDVGYANGSRLANSPRLLGKFNLSAPLPLVGLRLGHEGQYNSPRQAIDGSQIGGYALSNLNLSTGALAPRLDVALAVLNLFGRRDAHPGADTNRQNTLAQDGRSLRLEARWRN